MKMVSVIVPIYKVEKYLPQCVESIQKQTYREIEIILVDDGSPDRCPEMCDEFAKKDSRIKVIHKENGGLSDARNYGIDAASGDYLVFIDSDDYWDSNTALEKCIKVCTTLDADVTIFGFKKYYQDTGECEIIHMNVPNGDCTRLLPIEQLLKNNVFTTSACNKLIKASFFNDSPRIRFVKGQLSEDIEYCSQILLSAKKFAVFPENFYVYRQGRKGSISTSIGIKNITDIATVIDKYVNRTKRIDDRLPLLNYLSLQYVLLMTITTLLPYKEIKSVLMEMRKLWWITEYNWCPYVRRVSKVRWLGFEITRQLLGAYKRFK